MGVKSNQSFLGEEVLRYDINLSQLQRNFNAITRLLKPGVKLMAVVKGNAYGHGLVPISKALEQFGCHSLGVVRMSEAIRLREAGIKLPIVMLAPILPNQADAAVANGITVMVDNTAIVHELSKCAAKHNKIVKLHIKINTGLNRFGIKPEEALDFITAIHKEYQGLELEGIYTHFRDPEFNEKFTKKQIDMFAMLLEQLKEAGVRPAIAHAAASGGILMYPDAQFEMVRCGILLYGEEYLKGQRVMPNEVKPITTLTSCITKIIQVEKGQPIGYGDRFIANKDCRIAVIGAGYGDGVSRGWRQVLINGQRAQVLNYSMDCLEADITDITGTVKEYQEAVLIGNQGSERITWEDACYDLGFEVDEQLQRITDRVPRNYYFEK